jgi:elongation factor P
MRNLITRAVFDKTFKAGEKFAEPDLEKVEVAYQYTAGDMFFFMDQESFEELALRAEMIGDDKLLLADALILQVQKYNGSPIGLVFPPIVEMKVVSSEPGVRGDTASGGVTKAATLETGLVVRVPLHIKDGERIKVHTETHDFAGRA